MIPADVASQLRLVTPPEQQQPGAPQPITPVKQLVDVLGDLVPGQRVMAEIQMMLPNGTYRALVGQRDVTLALPFSAKAGDSLELEVVDNDGQVSLAFVANRSASGAQASSESVPTRLSNTGQLIGNLLTELDTEGKRAKPAALNNNQPLVESMPDSAEKLVPILKDALSKSGMFFESHQARWVQGKVDTSDLLQQPQGRLSPVLVRPEDFKTASAETTHGAKAHASDKVGSTSVTQANAEDQPVPTVKDPSLLDKAAAPRPMGLPPELTPIVQQQLDALSSQSYLWQGQIWPGQTMQWEIIEDEAERQRGESDDTPRWTTRLQLNLPRLGGVAAVLQLHGGNALELSLQADPGAQTTLRAHATSLREQLEAAGIQLNGLTISDAPDEQ